MVAATILRAAVGKSLGFDLRTFYGSKTRPSFSAEEVEFAASIASKSSGQIARLFLRNIDELGTRFGSHRFTPLEPGLAAVVSQRYLNDMGLWRDLHVR